MPDELPEIATPEADIWAALQLDLEPTDDSPPEMEPVDAAYVRTLIVTAEARLARWTGVTLTALGDDDDIPPELAQAIAIDVGAHYFNRLNPILPEAYFDAISPFRRWGFGAAIEDSEDSEESEA